MKKKRCWLFTGSVREAFLHDPTTPEALTRNKFARVHSRSGIATKHTERLKRLPFPGERRVQVLRRSSDGMETRSSADARIAYDAIISGMDRKRAA